MELRKISMNVGPYRLDIYNDFVVVYNSKTSREMLFLYGNGNIRNSSTGEYIK